MGTLSKTHNTPAKTLADCADRPDLAGGPAELTRIVFGGSVTVDPKELSRVALQLQSGALLQRLGFLIDIAGWRWPESIRRQLRAAIPKSARSTFGRADRKEGDIGYISDWGLFVHATRQDLLADIPSPHRDLTA